MAVPGGTLSEASLPELVSSFEAEYRRLYDRLCPDVAVEVLNWRVAVSGLVPN